MRNYEHIVKVNGRLYYLSGTKSVSEGKLEYLILISYNKPDEALAYYRIRWQVECLFQGIKSSGFNIEDTHVVALDRLEKLVLLVMIAFVWCYLIGDYIDRQIRPIQIKRHGRRAVSVSKYGLDYLSRVLLPEYNRFNIISLHLLLYTKSKGLN